MDSMPDEPSPIVATIDLDALASNLRAVQKTVGNTKIMGVVKADGYGHGAIPIARRLEAEGIEALGVARIEEGIELRQANIQKPIYILSGVYEPRAEELVRHQLTPIVFDLDTAEQIHHQLQKMDETLNFHLKVDTGMNRIGVTQATLGETLGHLEKLERLQLTGILSHLSESDSPDPSFTNLQIQEFQQAISESGVHTQNLQIHLANSAGALFHPSARLGMVRPGIALYGAMASTLSTPEIQFRPVMRLTTRVIHTKTVPAGTPISYGRTHITPRETTVATLAVGYGDGYHRTLSNQGSTLIHGQRAKILGAVCMDLTMVDVTNIPGTKPGDEAVLLGEAGNDQISAEEVANLMGTIPYEVLTSVHKRVPRVYTGELNT